MHRALSPDNFSALSNYEQRESDAYLRSSHWQPSPPTSISAEYGAHPRDGRVYERPTSPLSEAGLLAAIESHEELQTQDLLRRLSVAKRTPPKPAQTPSPPTSVQGTPSPTKIDALSYAEMQRIADQQYLQELRRPQFRRQESNQREWVFKPALREKQESPRCPTLPPKQVMVKIQEKERLEEQLCDEFLNKLSSGRNVRR
eukprot:TRINITY_DN36021_c0_g1_i1.p1 TRINITY_DN36021_c0_g1~~TRINITY_DN36021_c0_g1_i1.p1  ORF type:complete len:201 (+),score=35.29 TRINITY_DN36021_c0_g1_i1:38-640(+)